MRKLCAFLIAALALPPLWAFADSPVPGTLDQSITTQTGRSKPNWQVPLFGVDGDATGQLTVRPKVDKNGNVLIHEGANAVSASIMSFSLNDVGDATPFASNAFVVDGYTAISVRVIPHNANLVVSFQLQVDATGSSNWVPAGPAFGTETNLNNPAFPTSNNNANIWYVHDWPTSGHRMRLFCISGDGSLQTFQVMLVTGKRPTPTIGGEPALDGSDDVRAFQPYDATTLLFTLTSNGGANDKPVRLGGNVPNTQTTVTAQLPVTNGVSATVVAQLGSTNPGSSPYLFTNPVSSATGYQLNVGIGANGGGTMTSASGDLEIDVTFLTAPRTYVNTVFIASGNGGSDAVFVAPYGADRVQFAMPNRVRLTTTAWAMSATPWAVVATTSGRAVKGEGMPVDQTAGYTTDPMEYAVLGTSWYVASGGPDPEPAAAAYSVRPLLGVSTQSAAQAAVNPLTTLRLGETYRVTIGGASIKAGSTITLYFAFANQWALASTTVGVVVVRKNGT